MPAPMPSNATMKLHSGDSFQVADPMPKYRLVHMPGVRAGKIKMPLEIVGKLIEEKLLQLSEHYPANFGSALQLDEVSEDGTFRYTEFYQGQKTKKWANWTEENGSIQVIINGKKII